LLWGHCVAGDCGYGVPLATAARLSGARVPADNPMSTAKVQLGRYLFYDVRISLNGTMSCASCHRQELAFADGRSMPTGATGNYFGATP